MQWDVLCMYMCCAYPAAEGDSRLFSPAFTIASMPTLQQGILGIPSPAILSEIQSPIKHTACGVNVRACEDLLSINTCTIILDFGEVHLVGKQKKHAHTAEEVLNRSE